MRCRKVQKQLHLYVDGELSASRCNEIYDHLEDCLRCSEYLACLKGIGQELANTSVPEHPQELEDRIIAQVRKHKSQKVFKSADGKKFPEWDLLDRRVGYAMVTMAIVVGLIAGTLMGLYSTENALRPSRTVQDVEEQITEYYQLDALSDVPEDSVAWAYTKAIGNSINGKEVQ